MKNQLQYLRIQLKKLIGLLGRLAGITIVLALLVSAIAFYGTKLLYGNTTANKITIAVVTDDTSKWMELGMSYLESSESVHTFCRLLPASRQEAGQMLLDGRAAASIYFPETFSRDIINGRNTPAVITYAGNTGIEELLFQELAMAASRILRSAQAGVYTLSDLYDRYDFNGKRSRHLDYVNQHALQTAYIRSNLFVTEQVSSTNRLSTAEYYSASGIVLLLLLCGMSLGGFAAPETGSLSALLTRRGISAPLRTIWKCISLMLFFLTLMGVLLMIAAASGLVSWNCIFLLPSLAFFSSAWTIFAYTAAGSETSGTLLLFLAAFLCALCSGCLIPSAFLPRIVAAIGRHLPAYYIHQGAAAALTENSNLPDIVPLTLYSTGFLLISCAIACCRERRSAI